MRVVVAATSMLAALLGSPRIWPQAPAGTAEALFNDGLSAMKAERFDQACPCIEQSYRLEPLPGALFTGAECWRKAGKLATALARYEEYLGVFERMTPEQQKAQRGRDEIARDHASKLQARVPRLTIRFKASPPSGTRVEINEVPFGVPSLDRPLPVDPGEHVISVMVPDGRHLLRRMTLEPGDQKGIVLELPPLTTHGTMGPTRAERQSAFPDHSLQSLPVARAEPSRFPQAMIGYTAAAIGAAGLAVGAVTGALVLGKRETVDEQCGIGGDETACSAKGKAVADEAKALAVVSTVSFGVAIAGLGTGVVLIWTAGDRGPKTQVSRRSLAIHLSTSF